MKKIKYLIFILIILVIISLLIFWICKNKIDYSIFNKDGIILYSCNYGGGETTSQIRNTINGIYIDISGNVYKYEIPAIKENWGLGNIVISDTYRMAIPIEKIDHNIILSYTTEKIDTLSKKDIKQILYNADKISDIYVPTKIKAIDGKDSIVYLETANDKKLLVSPNEINISDAASNIINIIKSEKLIDSLDYYSAQD